MVLQEQEEVGGGAGESVLAGSLKSPIKVNWSVEEASDWLITQAQSFHTRTDETSTPLAARPQPIWLHGHV